MKQESQDIFTEMDQIKLAFDMIWLVEIFKIQILEIQIQILKIEFEDLIKAFNIAKNPKR